MTLAKIKNLLESEVDELTNLDPGEKITIDNVDVEFIQQEGDIYDNADVWVVFKIEDKFYKSYWTYSSWEGSDTDVFIKNIREVEPKQKTITVYE